MSGSGTAGKPEQAAEPAPSPDGIPAPDGGRGRNATSPWAIPAGGWKDILMRTWREAGDDNVGLVAAGVSFYGFLALVPMLGAIVISYGLVAEPASVVRHMQDLTSVMPADAARLIGEQLMNVVHTSEGKKGLGLLLALALALFGARNGAASIITALNIAYEEKETRSFIRLNLMSIGITLVGVVVAIAATIAIAALGHLDALFPGAPSAALTIGKILSYLLVGLGGAAGAATLYRYGPDRRNARWAWLTPGSAIAAALWLALTFGFGIYVANFGNYNATYGSLGTVVVMLTWFYLSAYVFLLGAELNSEIEHQTARDTTSGAERPLGMREATMADKVAGDPAPVVPVDRPPATLPAAGSVIVAAQPSFARDYAAARIGARATRLTGLGKVSALPSLLATGGLALLRRRNHARLGAALLVAGGLVAWLNAEDQPESTRPG